MLRALQWLLANNIYYRNFRIDPDALALLPEDGDLTSLRSVTVETNDQEIPPPQGDPHDAHTATSFVPSNLNPRMTEQETIRKSVLRKSVQEHQSHQPGETPPVVMWPPAEELPLMSSRLRATCRVPSS